MHSRIIPYIKFLRSVRLAITLIIYIIVFFTLASFIIQNESPDYYYYNYGKILGNIIIITGLNNFIRSLFFIIPGFLFFVNLLFCAFHRLLTRAKNNLPLRPGPDIIHFGVMMLLIGGSLSSALRQDRVIYLSPDERIEIAGRYELTLKKFEHMKYPDGRPKKWISTVLVKDGENNQKEFGVEVNKPASFGNYKLYQESYSLYEELTFKDRYGKFFKIRNNEGLKNFKNHIYFNKIENQKARLVIWDKKKSHIIRLLGRGESIDGFTLTDLSGGNLSGLKIVYDPGIMPVIISFIIISCGLFIAFYQKKGESGI